MFPEGCFNEHSGTLNDVGEFSSGLQGHRVGGKKELLSRLMGLIAEEEEANPELKCHAQLRGRSSFSDRTAASPGRRKLPPRPLLHSVGWHPRRGPACRSPSVRYR